MFPMKNMSIKFIKALFAVILTVFYSSVFIAQVGIGVPVGEEPQSTLDVRFDSATSPGFLMPRVTALPTGDIAEGMLVIYCAGCTDTDGDGQINYESGTYYVYVDNDGDGTLEWTPLTSNAGVVEVDTEAPSTPTNLTASNPSTSTIDLSWTASTDNVGVAGYFIYYNDGTLATTAPSNSITVNGLNSSTSYTFYVTAYDAVMNESGQSNNATQVTTGIPDTEAPTAPSSLVASNITTSSVDLSWNASTDNIAVVGYYVYQDGVQVSNVTGGTSTTISSLSESTQYSFYVTAYDAAGNESSQSNTVTPTTLCEQTPICVATFENGFDCWNDGGSGASRTVAQSNTGDYSVKLVGDSSSANIFSNSFDISGFTRVSLTFYVRTDRFDGGDRIYLDLSTGGSWVEIAYWQGSGANNSWTQLTLNITNPSYLAQSTSLRIRNAANKSYELLYVDDITITGHCN